MSQKILSKAILQTLIGEMTIEELKSKLREKYVFLDHDFEEVLIRLIRACLIRVVPHWVKFTHDQKDKNGIIIKRPGLFCEYIRKA